MWDQLHLECLKLLKDQRAVQDYSINSISRVIGYEIDKKHPIVNFVGDSGNVIKTIKLKGRRCLKKVARSHLNEVVVDFTIQPIEYININLEITK